MLRKSEIEKQIQTIMKDAESIGLTINSVIVKDEKIIRELEKCDIGPFKHKIKPHFVSVKNYPKAKIVDITEQEHGRMYGIKFLKSETVE